MRVIGRRHHSAKHNRARSARFYNAFNNKHSRVRFARFYNAFDDIHNRARSARFYDTIPYNNKHSTVCKAWWSNNVNCHSFTIPIGKKNTFLCLKGPYGSTANFHNEWLSLKKKLLELVTKSKGENIISCFWIQKI